jgi:uncharacterized membrane protein
LLGTRDRAAFLPAVLHSSDGEREIVYVVEEHSDGSLTILVPWAPTSFAGSVKIVSCDRVEMLETSLGDASRALSCWGVGVHDLLKKPDNKKLSAE